ncbi:unnamed protein product [Didymodactylos carnosus]|uniref:Uncharacterized protein n=1 Tax=Didymodactylos carnosus TaxID=1234261 RepID=A0A814UT72_9BILA|nr:unnamed protein product [Didymodactylos carnosus]CAF3943167.1 unnamed protein product [Didymodactylos carnosus]
MINLTSLTLTEISFYLLENILIKLSDLAHLSYLYNFLSLKTALLLLSEIQNGLFTTFLLLSYSQIKRVSLEYLTIGSCIIDDLSSFFCCVPNLKCLTMNLSLLGEAMTLNTNIRLSQLFSHLSCLTLNLHTINVGFDYVEQLITSFFVRLKRLSLLWIIKIQQSTMILNEYVNSKRLEHVSSSLEKFEFFIHIQYSGSNILSNNKEILLSTFTNGYWLKTRNANIVFEYNDEQEFIAYTLPCLKSDFRVINNSKTISIRPSIDYNNITALIYGNVWKERTVRVFDNVKTLVLNINDGLIDFMSHWNYFSYRKVEHLILLVHLGGRPPHSTSQVLLKLLQNAQKTDTLTLYFNHFEMQSIIFSDETLCVYLSKVIRKLTLKRLHLIESCNIETLCRVNQHQYTTWLKENPVLTQKFDIQCPIRLMTIWRNQD